MNPLAPAYRLSSPETGTEYWVYVDAPAAAPAPLVPVVFLDGDDQFAAGVAAARGGKVPGGERLLLVGLGYGASYAKPQNRRGRDYTPTRHADEPASGGAAAFARFVEETFWRDLARRYPLHPTARGLAGHSLSSLFVLHALFRARPFFTRFLASAPSIWWDDRSILAQVDALRRVQDSLPGRLYLGVGADDTPSMTGDLKLLEQRLAAAPFAGLEMASESFPGFNHYNVLPTTFAAGLRWLFGSA